MKNFIILLVAYAIVTLSPLQAQNYKYLGTYTADGTPEYLENPSDVISNETIEMVNTALPERYPVPDYNPHYISSGYDTDIHLNDRAEVFVTFVGEGAGYKNVLGFYTYDTNNPSETNPSPEDITIIFPNVSALHSGGSLLPGDKVKIGEFEAGTSIGWVLLANGWKGHVTAGLWQLYSNTDYNPESKENLRSHNVLLADEENQRVILGFEDIRRDNRGCDHDFNDAIFYVTANPFEAIVSDNMTKVEDVTDVTSANNGGLESNGTLAEKIAKRNFKRSVKHENADTKSRQPKMRAYRAMGSASSENSLQKYIPETGMFGNEGSHVSSPTDLIGITNAEEVFSIDYYTEEHRIAAALASYTPNHVYDHTKAICDRLNNSSLEDVRLVTVRGHQIIHARILRDSGEVENTLSFSVRKNGSNFQLHSYWNIDQYPEGDYYNFQVWGGSNSQVFAIANQIIDKFKEEGTVESSTKEEKIPNVFVKSGYYQNGKVHLEIINNTKTKTINLRANYKSTEHSESETLEKIIGLSGSRLETIEVETGRLFDAGISIKGIASKQIDALYLADGPWGIDYLEDGVAVNVYDIAQSKTPTPTDAYRVERNLFTSGSIKNTFNAFRQVLPGDQSFKVDGYNAIEFTSTSTHPIELVLMQSDLEDWENRYSYKVPVGTATHVIAIDEFKDKQGNSASIEDVKRIVFSLNGNGQSFEPFELSVSDVAFTNKIAVEENILVSDIEIDAKVYPNPFSEQATIKVNADMVKPTISVFNMAGSLVDIREVEVNADTILYKNNTLPNGVYVYVIKEGDEMIRGKFMVRK